MAQGILDGYRVLDFGRYIAAPYCCQLLADMGADVVRVERPGGEADRQRGPIDPSGQSLYFTALNRNKRSITLNLDTGQALLSRLVEQTDVLVHNLPAPRAERLGLGYAALGELNPRLVYLAVSGFGATGPLASRVAFDGVIQAMSGAMSFTGHAGGPPTLSHIPWVDFGTGLHGALGVVSALLHRERTGQGQQVDLALYGTALSFVGSYGILAEHARTGIARHQVGNDFIYAVGGCFEASDGRVVINVVTEPMWRNLCGAIGRPDLAADDRLASDLARYEHRSYINEAIQLWTATKTSDEIVAALGNAGVAVGPVRGIGELAGDEQAEALGIWQAIEQPGVGQVPVSRPPLQFSATPTRVERPAPSTGEHNEEVYGEWLGLAGDAVRDLARAGTI